MWWNGTECGRDDTLLLLPYKHLYPFSLSSLVDTRLQCHLVASGGFGGPDHAFLVDIWLRRHHVVGLFLSCLHILCIDGDLFVLVSGILWPDGCVLAAPNDFPWAGPVPVPLVFWGMRI